MICPKCSSQNEDGVMFCSNCGCKLSENNSSNLLNRRNIILVSIALLAVIIVCSIIKYNNKPINKWLRMMKSEEYVDAANYYKQNKNILNTEETNEVANYTIGTANELLNKYKNKEIEYEVAANQITKFTEMEIVESESNEILLTLDNIHNSRANFETAETSYNNNNYEDALNYYSKVISDDEPNFTQAQEKIAECTKKYRESILVSANELQGNKQYEDALTVVNSGLKQLKDDEELTSKANELSLLIDEETTQALISSVNELKTSGDLEGALKALSKYTGSDESVELLRSQISTDYENLISQKIVDLIASKEIDVAKKLINDANTLLPNSSVIDPWVTKIDEYYPVKLNELDTFTEEGHEKIYINDWNMGSDKDNLGNTDYFGIKYIAYNDFYGHNMSKKSTYIIDGKYNSLSGIWATCEQSKDKIKDKYFATLSIYGDGACLLTTPVTRGGIYPYEFDVDVSNVKELTLQIDCSGINSLYFAFLNPELRKTQID